MTEKNISMKKIQDSEVIFWDFDGVIKDSVSVKAEAFKILFSEYGREIVQKVVNHHYKK